MPASNAKELTPQISELRFKINPAQDEFCLVFRWPDRLWLHRATRISARQAEKAGGRGTTDQILL